MVFLLFLVNQRDGSDSGLVQPIEHMQLLGQVAQNNALDGHGRCGNRVTAAQARDQTERETAHTAQQIATAAPHTTPGQFGLKDGAMLFFVRFEFAQFAQKI